MKSQNSKNTTRKHAQNSPVDMARQERQIPALAVAAVAEAAERAQQSGLNRVIASNAQVIEVAPDGKRRVVKQIEPGVTVEKGKIFKLR